MLLWAYVMVFPIEHLGNFLLSSLLLKTFLFYVETVTVTSCLLLQRFPQAGLSVPNRSCPQTTTSSEMCLNAPAKKYKKRVSETIPSREMFLFPVIIFSKYTKLSSFFFFFCLVERSDLLQFCRVIKKYNLADLL